MLEDVLRTVKSTNRVNQAVVVSNDPEVFHIAKNFETTYLKEKKADLNEAVSGAVDWCIDRGATSVLVLPADIPLVMPRDLNKMLALEEKPSMVISPYRGGNSLDKLRKKGEA